MKNVLWSILLTAFVAFAPAEVMAQDRSVARLWNEILLEAIRNDYARPTVHARNLFHLSAASYDAWAAYDDVASPYFLGKTHHGTYVALDDFERPTDISAARQEAISYANFRLLSHRFSRSPGWPRVQALMTNLMDSLGYDPANIDRRYQDGSPAALGNYLAAQIIAYGMQDGANERQNYTNRSYESVNSPLLLTSPGVGTINDPNRWQPLQFVSFVDQSGNEIPSGTPLFLGAEWGNVSPFSLQEEDRHTVQRDGNTFQVYHDPGRPCFIDQNDSASSWHYQWGFALVSKWSSHLDPSDQVMWDISPRSMGNLSLEDFPKDIESLPEFYRTEGGQPEAGYAINPTTNQPYPEQMVYRGDYTRVLAEFWADGPDSETPPGHWFTLLNYINDHPLHENKFRGEGPPLTQLEWDVKSYFMLGGAMHDAAITAWSIKGYYDYIRPISAIRYLAAQGQSSDPDLPHYSPLGIQLDSGYVALVGADDPLAGEQNEHVGKIKLFAWKGHREIQDASEDQAGVGWILAEEWWPYQRPNFVTPPFAGYVSGHSTFSRAAAEVLTLLTGDEYFPGGMGEFVAKKDDFLVFERGPSTDVVLQWAKYYDASDQCSLSRIWGGIHPPVDDIPGRLIGAKVGKQAFEYARQYFDSEVVLSTRSEREKSVLTVYPNPATAGQTMTIEAPPGEYRGMIVGADGKILLQTNLIITLEGRARLTLPLAPAGVYLLRLQKDQFNRSARLFLSQ